MMDVISKGDPIRGYFWIRGSVNRRSKELGSQGSRNLSGSSHEIRSQKDEIVHKGFIRIST